MVVHVLEVKVIEDRGLLEEAGELLAVVVEGPGHEVAVYPRTRFGGWRQVGGGVCTMNIICN